MQTEELVAIPLTQELLDLAEIVENGYHASTMVADLLKETEIIKVVVVMAVIAMIQRRPYTPRLLQNKKLENLILK